MGSNVNKSTNAFKNVDPNAEVDTFIKKVWSKGPILNIADSMPYTITGKGANIAILIKVMIMPP